jgi:hypothetical protein
VPREAFASWEQLSAYVERRLGEPVAPRRILLARKDYEELRDAEVARDPEFAKAFFRNRVGPYVAPLLRRRMVIIERIN